jgi:ABC-type phosphate/phosphonate transport system substrate-binding protein
MVLGPLVVAVGLIGLAKAVEPAAPSPIHIGMMSTMFRDVPPGMFQALSKPFNTLMQAQTGMTGELALVSNPESLAKQLDTNEKQLGVFHGFEFAWVRKKYPALLPLVIAVGPNPKMAACLVVRKDGSATGMADLKGKTIAIGRGSKEHCRMYLERLKPVSADLKPFASISTPESIEDALDDVVDDVAQGTIVDIGTFAAYQDRKSGRAKKLKVVSESESFPPSVIVYRKDAMPDFVVKRLRDGLRGAASTTQAKNLMMLWRLSGFEAIPADYDTQLDAIAKAYPPPTPAADEPK